MKLITQRVKRARERAVRLAVKKAGGRPKVAQHFDVTPDAVRQWGLPDRRIPSEYVPELERLSGVSRIRMRPEVFGKAP